MKSPSALKPFAVLVSITLLLVLVPATSPAAPRGLSLLEGFEKAMISLADKVRPAVVSLSPYVPPSPSVATKNPLSRGRPTNAGAGVIINAAKGLIVTNSHVVRNAEKIQVTLLGGDKMVGRVLGTDDDTDLAVVQVEAEHPLASVQFADSSQVKVGQIVVAVGNPYGLNNTLTFGVVSGLNRENVNLSRYEDFIQTDASINPGNSGGPLINIRGELVGINTAIINYAQSIGFAIPSNIVKRVSSQLVEFGEVRRGWLGVGIEPVTPEVASHSDIKEGRGVLVNAVFEGDPAHVAGLKVGDIILKIGGAPVDSPSRMIKMIGGISPGQIVHLNILRDGKSKVIPVKLIRQTKNRKARISAPIEIKTPLGISVEAVGEKFSGKGGVIITQVDPASLAAEKGLQEGDRILAVNGQSISSRDRYEDVIKKVPTGGSVFLLLSRDGKKFHLALVREN
ncbi:MAG: trypsin-like peptidase domain-containing protein [Nitrospinaceae bacterium]